MKRDFIDLDRVLVKDYQVHGNYGFHTWTIIHIIPERKIKVGRTYRNKGNALRYNKVVDIIDFDEKLNLNYEPHLEKVKNKIFERRLEK